MSQRFIVHPTHPQIRLVRQAVQHRRSPTLALFRDPLQDPVNHDQLSKPEASSHLTAHALPPMYPIAATKCNAGGPVQRAHPQVTTP